uniref:Uncharacterized protein n=1 Tax=viral metagenome TaxID=1070528 RepID=A0A6M3II34_9ZZZZ
MRLFCRKCDKEIPEYKIEIIKQDNGLYMHMITVECHGKGWLRCFEDRHGPGFNTFVYENVYFFEKEESHTNWVAFKECADVLKHANIRNELGNCAEMIDREYNRVVNENEGLKERIERLKDGREGPFWKSKVWTEAWERFRKATLTWTKDKPTKPGWYWYRGLYQVQSSIIYITPNIDIVNSLKGSKGEWAGPIPEPNEELIIDDKFPFCPKCGEKL